MLLLLLLLLFDVCVYGMLAGCWLAQSHIMMNDK
jgi:hypothetical protein